LKSELHIKCEQICVCERTSEGRSNAGKEGYKVIGSCCDLVAFCDFIIGCSGVDTLQDEIGGSHEKEEALRATLEATLEKGGEKIFINTASGNWEFGAVIRSLKTISKEQVFNAQEKQDASGKDIYKDPLGDIIWRGTKGTIILPYGGYPLNFRGSPSSDQFWRMDTTLSALVACLLQARELVSSAQFGKKQVEEYMRQGSSDEQSQGLGVHVFIPLHPSLQALIVIYWLREWGAVVDYQEKLQKFVREYCDDKKKPVVLLDFMNGTKILNDSYYRRPLDAGCTGADVVITQGLQLESFRKFFADIGIIFEGQVDEMRKELRELVQPPALAHAEVVTPGSIASPDVVLSPPSFSRDGVALAVGRGPRMFDHGVLHGIPKEKRRTTEEEARCVVNDKRTAAPARSTATMAVFDNCEIDNFEEGGTYMYSGVAGDAGQPTMRVVVNSLVHHVVKPKTHMGVSHTPATEQPPPLRRPPDPKRDFYRLGELACRVDIGEGCMRNPLWADAREDFLTQYNLFVRLARFLEINILPERFDQNTTVTDYIRQIEAEVRTSFPPDLLLCFQLGWKMTHGAIFGASPSSMNSERKIVEAARIVSLQKIKSELVAHGINEDFVNTVDAIFVNQLRSPNPDFASTWQQLEEDLKARLFAEHRETMSTAPR